MSGSASGPMVLFDIDGTLVNSAGVGRRALDRAFESLYGVASAFDGYHFSGRTDLRIVYDAFDIHFHRRPEPSEVEAVRDAYLAAMARDLAKAPETVLVLPGVCALLEELTRRRVPVGLSTGNIVEGARLKLSAAGLWSYFPFGGFGCDCEDRGKLTALGIRRGREYVGRHIPGERIFVVGDSPLDVQAAHFAGANSLAVLTGWSSREELAAENPEVLLDDLSDLDAVLRVLA